MRRAKQGDIILFEGDSFLAFHGKKPPNLLTPAWDEFESHYWACGPAVLLVIESRKSMIGGDFIRVLGDLGPIWVYESDFKVMR